MKKYSNRNWYSNFKIYEFLHNDEFVIGVGLLLMKTGLEKCIEMWKFIKKI